MYCYYYYSPPPSPSGGEAPPSVATDGATLAKPSVSVVPGRSEGGGFRPCEVRAWTEDGAEGGVFFLATNDNQHGSKSEQSCIFFPTLLYFFHAGNNILSQLEKKTLNKRKKNTTVPEQNNFLEVPNARKKT